MKAYKLLRRRRNGTLGPLFIHRDLVVPIGEWLEAEDHPTKGFAHRPGWHVAPAPQAPHMSLNGRVWMHVEIEDFQTLKRPVCQGGIWLLAKRMKVVGPVEPQIQPQLL